MIELGSLIADTGERELNWLTSQEMLLDIA
jgi:hypothetical protein